jgi:integrase
LGQLLPSEITSDKLKDYRAHIHTENAQIRTASEAGRPLRDERSEQRLRTLSNESINKTLRTLAMILDEAEDRGWVDRNVARGRRTREPRERRPNRGALDVDEFLALMGAAEQLDNRHKPRTLETASQVRLPRDEAGLNWKVIAKRLSVAPSTAIYLYGCRDSADEPTCGVRRAIIATLGLAGPRVGEVCALNNQDINLAKARVSHPRRKDRRRHSVSRHPPQTSRRADRLPREPP